MRVSLLASALLLASTLHAQPGVESRGGLFAITGVVFNPGTGKFYAADANNTSVHVIDAATGREKSLTVGAHPEAIAVNATTGMTYVISAGDGSMAAIDKNDAITATVKIDRRPYFIAIDEKTNRAYISNTFSQNFTAVNLDTNTAAQWKLGTADIITVDPQSNKIYRLGYEAKGIEIVDGGTGFKETIPTGQVHHWAPAIDASRRMYYVTRVGTADVVAMNMDTHAQTIIKVGQYPCGIAINGKTHRVYVTNYVDNTLSVIDGEKNTVIATVPVGEKPQTVAVDETRDRIYVANAHGNSVTVIDGKKNRAVKTLPAGTNPYTVVADSKTGAVYVGNLNGPAFTKVLGPQK